MYIMSNCIAKCLQNDMIKKFAEILTLVKHSKITM